MNAIIVQARMGSSRLPGKILKKVLDKSLLEFEIERLRDVKSADKIILATTTDKKDDSVEELCKKIGVDYSRGSENDVLSRYYEAAKKFNCDVIVRVTADCPLIEPNVVDEAIQTFLKGKSMDYVSNTIDRTYPRGLDCEVFSFDALERAHREAKDAPDREHVTPYIKRSAKNSKNISHSQNLSQHRWTVDTEEDFELIKKILEAIYPKKKNFEMGDILSLLEKNPKWIEINAHIEQKK